VRLSKCEREGCLAGREEENQQQRRVSYGPALGSQQRPKSGHTVQQREAELKPATASSSRLFSGHLRQRKRG
jgi:hypothetical protein